MFEIQITELNVHKESGEDGKGGGGEEEEGVAEGWGVKGREPMTIHSSAKQTGKLNGSLHSPDE